MRIDLQFELVGGWERAQGSFLLRYFSTVSIYICKSYFPYDTRAEGTLARRLLA